MSYTEIKNTELPRFSLDRKLRCPVCGFKKWNIRHKKNELAGTIFQEQGLLVYGECMALFCARCEFSGGPMQTLALSEGIARDKMIKEELKKDSTAFGFNPPKRDGRVVACKNQEQ